MPPISLIIFIVKLLSPGFDVNIGIRNALPGCRRYDQIAIFQGCLVPTSLAIGKGEYSERFAMHSTVQ